MSKSPLLMKRRVYAWLLLSVFVPMMALSIIHSHDSSAHSFTVCSDCAHHVAHAGHIDMNGSHTHDCVLCQFTSIAFIGGSLLAVTAIFCFAQRPMQSSSSIPARRIEGLSLLRAPPTV